MKTIKTTCTDAELSAAVVRVPETNHMFASSDGKIYTDYRGQLRERKYSLDSDGYRQTTVHLISGTRKRVRVSQLIARLFLTKPEGERLEVCHKNDLKCDDRAENLYWGTHLQNVQDAVRNGRIRSRLTEGHRVAMKIAINSGESQSSVARKNGLSQGYLSAILWGRTRTKKAV